MEKYSATDLDEEFGNVLKGFMHEMYSWELAYYQKSIDAFDGDLSETELEETMRKDLLKIFRQYVLEGGRNYDRVENLVCGRYPEYDEVNDQIEVIDSSEKKVAVIIRKTKGLAAAFRLNFVVRDGVFMISGRDLQHGQKWQKTYV
ncbi:NTF2 fold immunity protein [Pseudomonas sp. NBRC 111130]|uniref:NTF2 fold immunity protein n=1 Tax=Pseudomonas sp. NBRC 111130 TaxID=1661045 RepID=UPI0006D460C0|nr:NTF2 fold immunity protein [Pseudomonas sp. NBRC 111130]